MIEANFFQTKDALVGFSISGHAGYDVYGKDVACASVTSAVQLTANGITEVLAIPADVLVLENKIELRLPSYSKQAVAFLDALLLHLRLLAEEYEDTIDVNVSEVYYYD